jgi:hypothetical protein
MDLLKRRKFLSFLGVSSAGIATAISIENSKQVIKEGGERANEEIGKLKKAYEELDRRSKLIIKLLLLTSGLDIFTSF